MSKKDEFLSRRDFFKKATKKTLPFLGAIVLGPTISLTTLTSCGCDGCEAACMDNCEDSCIGSCLTTCMGSCKGSSTKSSCSDCSSTCSGGCRDSSTSSSCSSCAESCSNSCNETCQDTCNDTCSTTCEDTCSGTCEGSAKGKPTTGTIDGHEYVDLGLSVLWATCNLGASKAEEFGEYFAFADPTGNNIITTEYSEEKEKNWSYYKALNLREGQSISGSQYDAAKYLWGQKWRLPTIDEFQEFLDNTTIEGYTRIEGTYRQYVTFKSKKNGNTIILPMAGESSSKKGYANETEYFSSWDDAFYWSGNVTEVSWVESNLYIYSRAACLAYVSYNWEAGFNVWRQAFDAFMPIRPIAERTGGNSNCNGSCTANCSSDCTSTCKNGCKAGCVNGCGNNCTGGCNETCTRTCADSCSNDCTGKCTATCADSCKAQTSQYCSNCASNCSSGCTTTCADACKAQTSQGCSDCSNDCTYGCGGSCERDCTGSCGMGCAQTCGGSCSNDCIGQCRRECKGGSYANATWCAGCVYGCDSYCANSCSFYCYSSCQNNGRKG